MGFVKKEEEEPGTGTLYIRVISAVTDDPADADDNLTIGDNYPFVCDSAI
jgi:hypothetical protein